MAFLADFGVLSRGYRKYLIKRRYLDLNEVIGGKKQCQNTGLSIKIINLINKYSFHSKTQIAIAVDG